MTERTIRTPRGNGNIPVQKMPDFSEALKAYMRLLGSKEVPGYDIEEAVFRISQNNKTRTQGNMFINLMQEVTRSPKF